MDRQQAVLTEGSRQYFGHTFSAWEADADIQDLEGSQAALHHKRNPTAKSGEGSGKIPSERKASCWRTHLDPICSPSSLAMHRTVQKVPPTHPACERRGAGSSCVFIKSGIGPGAETRLGEEVQTDLCLPQRELHWPSEEAQQKVRGSLATSAPQMALLQQRGCFKAL